MAGNVSEWTGILERALAQARAEGKVDAAKAAEIRADVENDWRSTNQPEVYLCDAAAAIAAGGKHGERVLELLKAHNL
ncbi:MAG: hypothetical protein JW900_05095 [Anaerolineae bacterium]|nr:hypothetical protein [Anaerolineae bacterium]